MKVVINVEFGGFQVSKELYEELGILWDGYGFLGNNDFGINSEDVYAYRAAPELIGAIEKLGTELSGNKSALEIVEVPDGASYEINDYAGREMIINVKEKAETFETGRFGIKRHKCCPVCEGVGGIPVAGLRSFWIKTEAAPPKGSTYTLCSGRLAMIQGASFHLPPW